MRVVQKDGRHESGALDRPGTSSGRAAAARPACRPRGAIRCSTALRGLRILVTLVLVLALLLIIAVVVFGVMLLTNAEAVLSWLDGILRQVQRIPFIGGEDSSGGG